jgi:hypothetical protein
LWTSSLLQMHEKLKKTAIQGSIFRRGWLSGFNPSSQHWFLNHPHCPRPPYRLTLPHSPWIADPGRYWFFDKSSPAAIISWPRHSVSTHLLSKGHSLPKKYALQVSNKRLHKNGYQFSLV